MSRGNPPRLRGWRLLMCDSVSCQNDNFTSCPDGIDCVNTFDAEGVVVESVAVDAASEADEVVPATESIPSAQETDTAREIVDTSSDAIIPDTISDVD
ncbi:hypothetical protein SARC_08895 [Sphaeroforma arctica JP610]|uniref:Uncharacterized protein n=1 Tax=Sphaeroforma arctica JP610 TaxID=667725 RepID=A0A0L0FPE5_9EUKA|nr:hypothetical protein SARC_08895 [Sphaeroforma arctica JP610]KNC78685.1 hypothetical protein SARC_08895 [Sphaeroforma arctica JP610]|eukprot:XP_014152587.1 hypothetical protein SARC_08895 [Sphaeroforma arctica JP610]